MNAPVLVAEGIRVAFGGIAAVDDMTVEVHPREVVGLIGPNGAGKTTLFEAISGFITPSAGSVRLNDADITALPVHRRVQLGLSRGFQDARMFPSLTVLDTLMVAQERHARRTSDLSGELLRLPSARATERRSRTVAEAMVERMGLERYRQTYIGELSTGTRRVVELAAVLSQEPSVLLLDEPTAGITASETEAFAEVLRREIAGTGMSLLLIEHDIPTVTKLCDRIYVMEAGRPLTSGTPAQVAADDRVLHAYFGTATVGASA